jgi:hypothetical protein
MSFGIRTAHSYTLGVEFGHEIKISKPGNEGYNIEITQPGVGCASIDLTAREANELCKWIGAKLAA